MCPCSRIKAACNLSTSHFVAHSISSGIHRQRLDLAFRNLAKEVYLPASKINPTLLRQSSSILGAQFCLRYCHIPVAAYSKACGKVQFDSM